MAIDFPANPVSGQQFTTGGVTWTFDGVKWTMGGTAPIYFGDASPLNPVPGTLWWDTVSAQLFIWYVDSTGNGQWVVTLNLGTAGPVGPEGPLGPVGPQGPVGPVGPQGLIADAPSDNTAYLRSDAGWESGGTLTETLNVTAPATGLVQINIASSDQSGNWIGGYTGPPAAATARWWLGLGDGTPETGGNVGQDFQIQAAADDGTYLGNYLIIDRATAEATFNGYVTSAAGLFYTQAPTAADNCHYWFLDPAGNTAGILYWLQSSNQMILQQQSSGGSISIDASGYFNTTGPSNFYSGNVLLEYYGLSYRGMAYGSASFIGFGWSTIIAGTVSVSIDNGGAAYAIANASDERMKEGIAPSTFDCLSTVLKFPLKQFRWKSYPEGDPWRLKEARAARDAPVIPVGMIAQQIHEIFPEGVRKGDDHDDHLGVVWDFDRNAMISLLIGAVQQLTKRVEELEAAR
jgi:hypothetical protein